MSDGGYEAHHGPLAVHELPLQPFVAELYIRLFILCSTLEAVSSTRMFSYFTARCCWDLGSFQQLDPVVVWPDRTVQLSLLVACTPAVIGYGAIFCD